LNLLCRIGGCSGIGFDQVGRSAGRLAACLAPASWPTITPSIASRIKGGLGHLHAGIILFGRSAPVTTRARPLIRRAQTRLFFRCSEYRLVIWAMRPAWHFLRALCVLCVLALENFFARPGFDNLQIHEGSQRTISVSRRAVFWQGENYEEFNVIGSKWRKSMILMASEPRYAS
jgi:hypothetical protein